MKFKMKLSSVYGSISVLLLLISFFVSCTKSGIKNEASSGESISLPKEGGQVIQEQNKYTFRLFQNAIEKDAYKANKLVSPLSIYLNLSMVYNGAKGSTQSGMAKALQLEDIGKQQLNKTNHKLIKGLPLVDPKVKLDIANSIWYRKNGEQPLSSFLKTVNKYYNAKIFPLDFTKNNAVEEINDWVATNTHQKIKKIVNKISPDDMMYLINAIYFDGKWSHKFDPSNTRERSFTTANGASVQSDFMTKTGYFNYAKEKNFSLIELPYGNGSYAMYVVLPSSNEGLKPLHFTSSLNEENFSQYVQGLDSVLVNLWLPKWEYSYAIPNLKPELSALGMDVAFQKGEADFTGMYPPEVGAYISKVAHKTYVKVNEVGTQAAAVTSTGVSSTSVTTPPPNARVMHVNRPFLYVIAEKKTGSILFIGWVNNPNNKG